MHVTGGYEQNLFVFRNKIAKDKGKANLELLYAYEIEEYV